jgi:hypothetical protein
MKILRSIFFSRLFCFLLHQRKPSQYQRVLKLDSGNNNAINRVKELTKKK